MADATTEFFDQLSLRGSEPLLRRGAGTIRFELRSGEAIDRWRVSITAETVEVKHRGGTADCVVRADRALFDQIVTGRANAMASMLRGVLTVEGDPSSLVLLQRLFPGPPAAADGRKARGEKVRS